MTRLEQYEAMTMAGHRRRRSAIDEFVAKIELLAREELMRTQVVDDVDIAKALMLVAMHIGSTEPHEAHAMRECIFMTQWVEYAFKLILAKVAEDR